MIDVNKYRKILDEGLLLDHYMLLCNIRDGQELLKNKRVQGFINLLCKKGYIDSDTLTDKAMLLIDEPITTGNPVVKLEDEKVVNEGKFDYGSWVIRLWKACQKKLIEQTGKRQVRPKIDGVAYSFLPNPTDLGKVILRAVGAYKLTDYDKIEKAILGYIDRCHKQDRWTPLLHYWIMKNNMSTMVTEMDAMEEEDSKDNDTIVNI